MKLEVVQVKGQGASSSSETDFSKREENEINKISNSSEIREKRKLMPNGLYILHKVYVVL